MTTPEAFRICLVCDDPIIEAAVHTSYSPPYEIEVFSAAGLLNEKHTLSEHGEGIIDAALSCQVLLLDWAFDDAPAINTLCYHVRRRVAVPIYGLCQGNQDVMSSCIAAGMDDALTFPLYPSYLQAKVLSYHRLVKAAQEALTQQQGKDEPESLTRVVHQFGDLKLDDTAHRFFIRSVEVLLTPREYALLHFFIDRHDTLCTREQILDHVWGITFDTGTNMVDVYTYFLRRKLEAHGLKDMIETVRGQGYRLVLPR